MQNFTIVSDIFGSGLVIVPLCIPTDYNSAMQLHCKGHGTGGPCDHEYGSGDMGNDCLNTSVMAHFRCQVGWIQDTREFVQWIAKFIYEVWGVLLWNE